MASQVSKIEPDKKVTEYIPIFSWENPTPGNLFHQENFIQGNLILPPGGKILFPTGEISISYRGNISFPTGEICISYQENFYFPPTHWFPSEEKLLPRGE